MLEFLYWIAEQRGFEGGFNLIRYQTFRAGAAVATALLIGLIIGPRFIGWLRVRQGKGQPIRADGPQTHLAKRGTPTMGGLMILTSLVLAVLIWMDLSNPFVWACLFVTLGFGAIGFLDDYDKVRKASTAGVSGRVRLLLEFAIAGVAAFVVLTILGAPFAFPLALVVAFFDLIPVVGATIAAVLIAVGLVLTGVLTLREGRVAVDLNVIVVIGAAFGLGAAMETSGLAQQGADLLLSAFSAFGSDDMRKPTIAPSMP